MNKKRQSFFSATKFLLHFQAAEMNIDENKKKSFKKRVF